MTYLINYDLSTPGQNYAPLICAIQSYGSWAKINRSCWIIKTEQNAVQIRDYLSPFIDKNDLLFICQFSNWASLNFRKEITDWI